MVVTEPLRSLAPGVAAHVVTLSVVALPPLTPQFGLTPSSNH
jgi:hypothetical protein